MKFLKVIGFLLLSFIIIMSGGFIWYYNLYPQSVYDASDFNIEVIKSLNDYNQNGIDDYSDIVLGARADAKNEPTYHSAYYTGGYPPKDEGVCTDVVWRAFEFAGYDLKALIDEDIKQHTELYPRVENNPDPNIDFRRVPNLKVFFERHGTSLTLDPYEIDQWQPGDIVIFGNNVHIGIISDKRNHEGIPYLIHNGGQPNREENALVKYSVFVPITAHYRFND